MKLNVIIFLLMALALTVQPVSAQTIEDVLILFSESDLNEVGPPVVEAFGIAVGGGLYHTANTHRVLGFDVGVRVMTVIVPEGESEVFDSLDWAAFPAPILQASVGLPMDFEVMARGLTFNWNGESYSIYGGGLKKNFGSLFPVPGFPDLSVMIAYQKFQAEDVITSTHFSVDFIASKTLAIITPYVGLGFDKTSMNFDYTYIVTDTPVDRTIDANTTRFTLGLNATPFPFMKVFADYNISDYAEVTAGLAFNF